MNGNAPWPWPPELEAELIRLFANGTRVKVIAHKLDRPQSAVSRHVWRLQQQGRCPRRKLEWTPAHERVLEAALSMGVSYDDLAEALDRSRDAVKMHASKLRRRLRAIAANDPGAQAEWAEEQLQLELRA